MALGAELWRLRRLARASASGADNEAASDVEPTQESAQAEAGSADAPDWTPASVARVLEGVVLRGAHALRRASWLCRLSESVVAWRRPGQLSWRLLVIRGGVVVGRRWEPALHGTVEAPGIGLAMPERRRSFDVPTFDRMQVLSTELKRLVSESADLSLRCGPRAWLDSDRLANALSWV